MLDPLPPPPEAPKPDTGTLLREAWNAAAPDIISTALLLARRGDVPALRLVLERIAPLRRTVSLELPPLDSVADVPGIARKLIELVATAILTPGEASEITKTLEAYVAAVAATEHEHRLAAIEKSLREAAGGH